MKSLAKKALISSNKRSFASSITIKLVNDHSMLIFTAQIRTSQTRRQYDAKGSHHQQGGVDEVLH